MTGQDLDTLAFQSPDAFARWLADHPDSPGIWLRFARKGSGEPSVTYPEAVEAALCHGWIDGQAAADDDQHWLQRFTPRRARSRWSQINRDRADRLIRAGAMTPAGQAEVDRAKADGRWDAAYAGQASATVPVDLRTALDANPAAAAAFDALDRANRYAVIYRIRDARRPDTRARRIEDFVAMLARGETIHPRRNGRGPVL